MPQLQVFEWFAWEDYLITHIAPGAARVPVTPGIRLCSVKQRGAPAIVHVDLSRPRTVFPDYEHWLMSYEQLGLPVLNGYCLSIDKWAVQDACAAAGLPQVRAARDGDPDEMLIIKTRANHIGKYERLLAPEVAGDMSPPPWPYPERVHRLARRDVPDAMWDDPRIAVERYITNAQGLFQRAYVAGDYVAVATSASPKLIKEMNHRKGVDLISTTSASERPNDPRDSLSAAFRLAQAMRVDFAALDLALDDAGIPHPIDLNTTPAGWEDPTVNPRLIGELIDAFDSLLANGSRYSPARKSSDVERIAIETAFDGSQPGGQSTDYTV